MTSAPSWKMAAARPSSRAPGRPGGRWPAGRSAWACTSGVSPARPTAGSPNRRRWHRRARNGRLARRRWPTVRSSRASWAVWKNSGCWPRVQRNSSGSTAPRRPAAWSRWRSGYRSPRAEGPGRQQPLIECGAAFLRSRGQPTEVAMALLHQGSVLRALGERERSQAAITEARSIIGSCPDPGILTRRLSACGPSPRADTSSRGREADAAGAQGAPAADQRSVRARHRP